MSIQNMTSKVIMDIISVKDIKDKTNQTIIKKLYEEFEKGNSNTNNVLDWFEEEKIITLGELTPEWWI